MDILIIDYEDLDHQIAKSRTISDALHRLNKILGDSDKRALAYAFMVHSHNNVRNDVISATTSIPQWALKVFERVGGFATDVVFSRISEIEEPFWIDNEELAANSTARGDGRARFYSVVLKLVGPIGWVCPIVGPDVFGYGVLNHFYKDDVEKRKGLSREQLKKLAYEFHVRARKHGLISNYIGLTQKEKETLKLCVQGNSMEDISHALNVSGRSIEYRLQNCRKKLRARNIAETIYKAHAYGALPSTTTLKSSDRGEIIQR